MEPLFLGAPNLGRLLHSSRHTPRWFENWRGSHSPCTPNAPYVYSILGNGSRYTSTSLLPDVTVDSTYLHNSTYLQVKKHVIRHASKFLHLRQNAIFLPLQAFRWNNHIAESSLQDVHASENGLLFLGWNRQFGLISSNA